MANTFTLISTITVGSGGASSIDFTSIPSTFTDLCLKVSARTNRGATYIVDSIVLKVNGSSSSYTNRIIYGTGSSVVSTTDTTSLYGLGGAVSNYSTANTFGNAEYYIPNYTSSNYKSASFDGVGENNATEAWMGLGAGLWSNTAAINQLTLTVAGGTTWLQYSSASLYGILKA